jgi:hypothetical protein
MTLGEKMFDKFIGKVVIIEWEQQTIVDWGRDPIDPDNYRDCGFLAKDKNGNYGLVYLPHSHEYQVKKMLLMNDIKVSDIASLKESAIQYNHSQLGSDSLYCMTKFNLSFGTLNNINTISQTVTNVLQKSCNTCIHSNLLNYVCNKNFKHLKDFNGVCSEWTN